MIADRPVTEMLGLVMVSTNLFRISLLVFGLTSISPLLGVETTASPDEPAQAADSSAKSSEKSESQTKTLDAEVVIQGQTIRYRAVATQLEIEKDAGGAKASIFHVSYLRTDVAQDTERPVMFCFNGGPGSSSVWLHLGGIGPKRLDLEASGLQAPRPPVHLKANPLSILDVCDLVFVDPVSTGYSRAKDSKKAGEFHGLENDIESTAEFVRRWTTENKRWSSPKYLLGESYGGIRVAGLASRLQSRYGMSLNGVILLSSLLDFQTLQPSPGNDLAYLVYLPVFASTAHFHGKVAGDRDELVRVTKEFAFGEYARVLLAGTDGPEAEREAAAEKLAELTGISSGEWLKWDLRIDPSVFRSELLRDEGKVLGRFDARVAWPASSQAAQVPDYDPSFAMAWGAFSTGMMQYLTEDFQWEEKQPYEMLTGKVHPWKWDTSNRVVQVGQRLAAAMRDNPHLRILVMGGHADLATPPEGVAYSLRHLPELSAQARARISVAHFEAGHMFYLNEADLKKSRDDLVKFLEES